MERGAWGGLLLDSSHEQHPVRLHIWNNGANTHTHVHTVRVMSHTVLYMW